MYIARGVWLINDFYRRTRFLNNPHFTRQCNWFIMHMESDTYMQHGTSTIYYSAATMIAQWLVDEVMIEQWLVGDVIDWSMIG